MGQGMMGIRHRWRGFLRRRLERMRERIDRRIQRLEEKRQRLEARVPPEGERPETPGEGAAESQPARGRRRRARRTPPAS